MTNDRQRDEGARADRRWSPLDWWEIVGIVAFTAWIAWPFLQPGGYVTDFDTVAYSGPNLEATYRAWGEHRVPWWEPGVFGGTAFSANLQTGVFYPLKAVFWPLGAGAAMGAMTATHLFVLAFGMRHLARRTLRLSAPAGLVAAVVMVGAGTTMVRTVRFEQLSVIAWAPWLLVAVDAVIFARPGRTRRPIAWCALATAAIVLSGHPQPAHMVAVLTGVWTIGRLLDSRSRASVGTGEGTGPDGPEAPADSMGRKVGRVAAATLLGAGISAVALVTALPTFGAGAVTSDVLLEQASFGVYVLDPLTAVTTFFGDVWANAEPLTYPTAEGPAFLGVAAIGLAIVGAAVGASRRRVTRLPVRATTLTLLITIVVTVLMAFGPGAVVYRVVAAVVPGVGQGRVPLRWLYLTTFAVALLAAIGASALRDRVIVGRTRLVRVVGVGLAIVAVAAVAPPYGATAPSFLTRATWLAVVAVVAGAVVIGAREMSGREMSGRGATGRAAVVLGLVVLALVLVELGVPAGNSYGRQLRRPESFVTTSRNEINSFLLASGGRYPVVGDSDANSSLTAGTRSLDGYDGGLWLTDAYVAVGQQLVGETFDPLGRLGEQIRVPLDDAALARFGVRYVVIDPHKRIVQAGGRSPIDDSDVVRVRQELVPGWIGPVLVDGTREVWENPRYESEALIHPGGVDQPGQPASMERPVPGAIDVTVPPDSTGVLVVAEQAQPGWEVVVDGEPTELVDVDGFALAVDLPPGARQVEFRYRPPGLALGVGLLVLSIAAVLFLALVPEKRLDRPSKHGSD